MRGNIIGKNRIFVAPKDNKEDSKHNKEEPKGNKEVLNQDGKKHQKLKIIRIIVVLLAGTVLLGAVGFCIYLAATQS